MLVDFGWDLYDFKSLKEVFLEIKIFLEVIRSQQRDEFLISNNNYWNLEKVYLNLLSNTLCE